MPVPCRSKGHADKQWPYTEFMCFVGELDPRRREYLDRKIHNVMEYATSFKDVAELHALEWIPKRLPKGNYLTLGLYLYLADECSRLGKEKSFLTVMREAGATLKYADVPNDWEKRLNLGAICGGLGKNKAFLKALREAETAMKDSEGLELGKLLSQTGETLEREGKKEASLRRVKTARKYRSLAYQCHHLAADPLFVTVTREADASAKSGENPTAEQRLAGAERSLRLRDLKETLFSRVEDALQLQGMKKSHGAILREWANTGGYTIHGKRNDERSENGKRKLRGAYACLARDIAMESEVVGMSLPISFALGNERKMAKMKTKEKAYSFINDLSQSVYHAPIDPYIRQCIAEGYEARVQKIWEVIDTKMQRLWEENKHRLRASEEGDKELARNVFSKMPRAALEILFLQDHDFALARQKDISSVYPDEPLPGDSRKEFDSYRISNGLRHPRNRTIFLSYTSQKYADGPEGQRQLIDRVGSMLLHEAMHEAIAHLSKKEKESLWKAVGNVHREIHARGNTLPDYMDKQGLKVDLDYDSEYYKQYPNGRMEEMVCNLAGMMVKYPYPARRDGNGASLADNPFADLKMLPPLADQILDVFALVSKRCQRLSYEKLPQPETSKKTIQVAG